MKFKETRLIAGGLMRCCTDTIHEYVEAHRDEEVKEDIYLDCEYEAPDNQQILLRAGTWQWAGMKQA